MKGYRTPSWFRIKRFSRGKQEQPPKTSPRPIKVKEATRKAK